MLSVQFKAPHSLIEGRTLRPLEQAVLLGILEDLVDERAHGLLDVDVLLGRSREPTCESVRLMFFNSKRVKYLLSNK